MKRNTYLFLCTIVLLSCSKDKENKPTSAQLLVSGKWYLESPAANACQKKINFEFFANGNYISNNYTLNAAQTCDYSGQLVASYILRDENTIVITAGTSSLVYSIISITDSRLLYTANGSIYEWDKTEN